MGQQLGWKFLDCDSDWGGGEMGADWLSVATNGCQCLARPG